MSEPRKPTDLATKAAAAAEETPAVVWTPYSINARCTECELCIPVCPTDAIFHGVGRMVIDYDTCNGCGACPSICPESAIHPLAPRTVLKSGS